MQGFHCKLLRYRSYIKHRLGKLEMKLGVQPPHEEDTSLKRTRVLEQREKKIKTVDNATRENSLLLVDFILDLLYVPIQNHTHKFKSYIQISYIGFYCVYSYATISRYYKYL